MTEPNPGEDFRVTRFILVCLVATLSASCSAIRIGYAFVDTYIEEQVEEYLLLDDQDEAVLEAQVDQFMQEHRTTLLPRYAMFLREVAKVASAAKSDRAAVDAQFTAAQVLYADTVAVAVPYVGVVLARHTKRKNLKYLRERMAEYEMTLRDTLQAPKEKLIDQRAYATAEGMEHFIDELDEIQRLKVRVHIENMYVDPAYWLRNRKRRTMAFESLMANQPGATDIAEFVRELWTAPYEFSEPSYRAYFETTTAKTKNMVFDVVRSLSPAQRQSFRETLLDYAGQLADIAG